MTPFRRSPRHRERPFPVLSAGCDQVWQRKRLVGLVSIVRETTVRSWVSGKSLAAGILDAPQPVVSAIPLTYFSQRAKALVEPAAQRWIRAEPPWANAWTCSSVAIVVSPGKVVSSAP